MVFCRFLGSDDPDTFFSDTQRHKIVWEILTTAAYGKKRRAEIGIRRLLEEYAYTAAYPLHDVSVDEKHYHRIESFRIICIHLHHWLFQVLGNAFEI